MSMYRVRDGSTFGGIVTLGPGTLIELNDAEAAAFFDKLERVETSAAIDEEETDAEPKTEQAKGKRKG